MCDCQQRLRHDAESLLAQGDRLLRDPRTRRNGALCRAHAMSLALAIGHLNRRQQMTETLTTIKPCAKPSCKLEDGHDGICRDRWTKPLVKPPGGSKPVAYFRATKFVDVVEDRYNLEKWQQRQVALGLAVSPDLLLKVAAADPDDRDVINDLCEQAQTEAKANVKRDRGTFLHALSEIADAGAELPDYLDLPGIGRMETTDADRSAVMAYVNATRCFTHLHTEALTVVDSLKVAGTPDRISHYVGPGPDGKTPVDWNIVTDLKSGNMDYGQLKTAGQLALYSRAELLDVETWARSPLPDVRQDWGVIVDLDAEQGTCELRWLDLTLGWEVVEEAARVRALRRRDRTAFRPFVGPSVDLTALIELCGDVESLAALWRQHKAAWTPELTAAAEARKSTLAASAA
jgi:hypothetical protein